MPKILTNLRIRRNHAGRPRTKSIGPGNCPVGTRTSVTTRMLISMAITHPTNSTATAVPIPTLSGGKGTEISRWSSSDTSKGLATKLAMKESRNVRGQPTGTPISRRTVQAATIVLRTTEMMMISVDMGASVGQVLLVNTALRKI